MSSEQLSSGRGNWQGLEKLSQFAAAFCLVAIFVLLMLEVVFRFLRVEFYWGSELGGILMAWLTLFCLPWLTRNRTASVQ